MTENMAGLALHLKMWAKFLQSQVIPLQPITFPKPVKNLRHPLDQLLVFYGYNKVCTL
jgi:hypothetical protein